MPKSKKNSTWSWSISVTQYDCEPCLNLEEKLALERWFYRRTNTTIALPWKKVPVEALRRLMQPIQDAMTITNADMEKFRCTARTLFAEMYKRQTAFWAWDDSGWVEVYKSCISGNSVYTRPPVLHMLACAYILCEFTKFKALGNRSFRFYDLAALVFDPIVLDTSIQQITNTLLTWGYGPSVSVEIKSVLSYWLLLARSPYLEHISDEIVHDLSHLTTRQRTAAVAISRVLCQLNIIDQEIKFRNKVNNAWLKEKVVSGVSEEWLSWVERWNSISTLEPDTRREIYLHMMHVGRWLELYHPHITSPGDWTRQLALEYVAAVDKMTIGEYAIRPQVLADRIGKPITARYKACRLSAMRSFFRDCQEWDWIPHKFTVNRVLATPRAVRAKISTNPRIIADDVWAKLLWAGLDLTADDLKSVTNPNSDPTKTDNLLPSFYPYELVKAITITWLFAGLRRDEIMRLRVGCIRWDYKEESTDSICLMDVPVNKTGTAFTKPVSGIVGKVIATWQNVRPAQPKALDKKTSELVDYLFSFRGRQVGRDIINDTIIPLLCFKAGVPEKDTRGAITSHRARATIASQLANAKEPMSLFELQQWLGHSSPASTQHYVKLSPMKLTQSYKDAGYLDRNLRSIQVLIDRDAISTGAASNGQPYLYYDLGHGYCTYDFFDKCPHRMICAKCEYYQPKDLNQLLESKANLQKMLLEIPLNEDEEMAVRDGIEAVERLYDKLKDVPTPSGLTPRQIGNGNSSLIPLDSIRVNPET